MKLTTFTDYSLRVLMYLAVRPDVRATVAEIAGVFEISEHHLVKVVHFLGRNGWITTVRGKGGGMELGQPPQAISVGEVVRATEGAASVAECFEPEGSHCGIAPVCQLRGVLGEAVAAFYGVLDRYTLADVVRNREQLSRILFHESAAAGRPPARPASDAAA